jgi:hypothetical protein
MPRDYDLMERIRQQSSMSKQLVSTKDKEYGWYAGGSWEIAEKMAIVDTMLKNNLIPEKFKIFVLLYRSYLNQKRKAFFASVGSTEITKLGLMLGLDDNTVTATK